MDPRLNSEFKFWTFFFLWLATLIFLQITHTTDVIDQYRTRHERVERIVTTIIKIYYEQSRQWVNEQNCNRSSPHRFLISR